MKPTSINKHFLAMIKSIFPKHAELTECHVSGELHYRVQWKLNNDRLRPNKRSAPIEIIFDEEALADYVEDECNIDRADLFIQRYLNIRLSEFDGNHELPYNQEPEIAKWYIRSSIFQL